MNPKDWADQQGIHPQTAYEWFRKRAVPVLARRVSRQPLKVGVEEVPRTTANLVRRTLEGARRHTEAGI